MVGEARVKKAVDEFVRSGLTSTVLNRNAKFEVESADNWLPPVRHYLAKMGRNDLIVRVEGADVILAKRGW
jgi:hypothetical protein